MDDTRVQMLRPSLSLSGLVLAFSLVCPGGAHAGGELAQSGGHLEALLDGKPIDLAAVALYHCHDRAAPVIHCFEAAEDRDDDAHVLEAELTIGGEAQGFLAGGSLTVLSVTFVLWYEDSNYGGASFSAAAPISNLGTLGWSNRISSFKSTNGGRPKWWDGTSYTGWYWHWGTSAWVPYVGDNANDRFSSVQNVP